MCGIIAFFLRTFTFSFVIMRYTREKFRLKLIHGIIAGDILNEDYAKHVELLSSSCGNSLLSLLYFIYFT